jgi:hypothetical protein
MQIQQTERVFRYSGGLVLPDPDPSLGIEAVRQVYCLVVSGNYHRRGERSGIGGWKTGLYVQNGSGHKSLNSR